MKWLVSLRGDPEDIQELCTVKVSEWQIVEENGIYYLAFGDFDGLDATGAVKRARELMQDARVVASLFCGGYQSVVVNEDAIRIEDDGTRRRTIFSDFSNVASATTKRLTAVAPPAGEVGAILSLKARDPRVADVLHYLHVGDWRSLSNAYESVRDDLGSTPKSGGAEIDRRWPKLGAEAKRFRDTVNSVDAIGLEARHVRSTHRIPPPDPMSFTEAKEWVTTLVREWLLAKVAGQRR